MYLNCHVTYYFTFLDGNNTITNHDKFFLKKLIKFMNIKN